GRRIQKTANGTTTWFLWDGDDLLSEFDGTGTRSRRYAYAGGFAPIQVADPTGPGTEVVYDVHTDHLDTPRMLTNASEASVWRQSHESFGAAVVDPTSTVAFNTRFPGQYADGETDLHYNRFRYFDPATGRYINADPIGQWGEINIFGYAKNAPSRNIDPKGEDVEVGVRHFYPTAVPYARHCFLRFDKNNGDTMSFDRGGVHADPNPGGANFTPTTGLSNDQCVRNEMKKCEGKNYNLFQFNCCQCASNALSACGLGNSGTWPNAPFGANNPPYLPPKLRRAVVRRSSW
ncbi:MAG: hypothetical protein GY937_17875, partial [bacterium]|nr:hypothetical protein [bacterium]